MNRDSPEIRVGSNPDMIRVLKTAIRNGLLPDTYVTAGDLVCMETVSGALACAVDEDAPLPVTASRITPAVLAGMLADHTSVIRTRARKSDKGLEFFDEEITPPRDVLSSVLAAKTWASLPPLRGVIGAPVLRQDGTLLQQPGYDQATGFYLASSIDLPPVPDEPTTEQVNAARRFLLRELLADFPWSQPADRANYLALLVTPILRYYTRSLTPFALIDATMPASGKTILTAGPGMLYGQRVLTWPDNNDEELRKSITAVFLDQVGCVVFDNLPEGTVIDSAVLAQLVTGKTWNDRQLGSTRTLSAVNDRLWMATGNNLQVGGDMASRTVRVHLDPNMPKPEARDQSRFGIPHLDQWITDPAHQMTVMWHLLVLVLDWIRAGAPRRRDLSMRQFTPWAHALGGFLAHHQVTGFLANLADIADIDEDETRWRAFLTCWHTRHADKHLTASDLCRDGRPDRFGPEETDPWDGTFITTHTGRTPNAFSLGRLLGGQAGRWRGEYVLRTGPHDRGNRAAYWVEHHQT